jgi:WD40 repeat protein
MALVVGDQFIRICQAPSGAVVREFPDSNSFPIRHGRSTAEEEENPPWASPYRRLDPTAVSICLDGRQVAAALSSGVAIWDAETGRELCTLGTGTCLAWSPDGRLLAVSGAGKDAPIVLYDPNGQQVRQIAHSGNGFSALAFTHDGKYLVAAGMGREAMRGWGYVLDVQTGKEAGRIEPEKGNFAAVVCSPTENLVAVAHQDGTIGVYELGGLAPATRPSTAPGQGPDEIGVVELHRLKGHNGWVRALAFSGDGKMLASGGWDRRVHIWDVRRGAEVLSDAGHRGSVGVAIFSPDARTVATGGDDGTVRLWNAQGRQLKLWRGGQKGVYDLSFAADGNSLACALPEDVFLWRAPWQKDPEPLGLYRRPGSDPTVEPNASVPRCRWLRFDAEGKRLVCVDSSGHVATLDAAGRSSAPFEGPGVIGPSSVTFSSDGRQVAMAASSVVRVLETLTGRELVAIRDFTKGFPRQTCLSPQADVLAIAGPAAIVLVEVESAGETAKLPAEPPYGLKVTMAFSDDGMLLAVAVGEGSVLIFDARAGKQVHSLEGHRGAVNDIRFSRDNRRLLTASADGTAIIWSLDKVAASGAPPRKRLSEGEMKALWEQLADKDAGRARAGVWGLVAGGDDTVAFLKTHLRPVVQEDANRVRKLLDELDSPKFADRQKAFAELSKLSAVAEPELRGALKDARNEELKQRIETLLKGLTSPASQDAEMLRTCRGITVLEKIATPQAVELLKAIGQGAATARPTLRALAASGRLALRQP